MKDPYRLEKKDNYIFWISKWCHDKYTKEQLKAKPINELQEIYNKLLADKTSKIY